MTASNQPAVLEVSGVQWAASKNVAEAVLSRRPGVLEVEANPVAQTATVTYDPSQTSVAELAGWVRLRISLCRPVGSGAHLRSPGRAQAHAAKHDHLQAGHQTPADDHHSGHQHDHRRAGKATTIPVPMLIMLLMPL